MRALEKSGREVLAAVKATRERNIRYAHLRPVGQHSFGCLDSAVDQVPRRRHIGNLPAVVGERGRPQRTLVGHFVEGPFLFHVQEKRIEKQFHGPARGNEALIQFDVALLEQFAQGNEQLVNV